MLFLHPWLLAGLAAAAIPIVIHLVRRRSARPIEWGAMRFLFDTVSVRRRKMEWEDLLLMAARCLLIALAALAICRPFVPPDSQVPWLFVLPAALLGIALFGASFVLGGAKSRWLARLAAVALLVAAGALVVLEKRLNLKRFQATGRRDVALVIDASASMEIVRDGKSAFQRAVAEARQLVVEAPQGTAFSVVLGGPAPEAITAEPLHHRADVLGVLDNLQPAGGSFRAHDALGMATLGLAQGTNSSKQIVVFTDAQRSGWRLENPGAWDALAAAWKTLPTRPKLILRDLGAPADFRNAALSTLEISRGLVGTDRAVVLRVTVENTGAVPVTPGPVSVEIDGKFIGKSPVGLLAAGQTDTVEVRHRFTRAGPNVVTARLDTPDDLSSDNRIERVVLVRQRLPILLVEGNPAGSFFDRAAGYSALALAPSAALIGGKSAGATFLMDPRVVAATALQPEDFDNASVIVLADVPRLPARLAGLLAGKVAQGSGLIVIAGPRADAAFYNGWQGIGGPVLPLPLGPEAADPAKSGISPAPSTFTHEALAGLGGKSDLGTARVSRWRATGPPAAGAALAAAFSNGDAFLATRTFGNGRVVLATCAFDARSGNLPAKRGFVPLVHELAAWAAGSGAELNTDASWNPSFALSSWSGGLSASYFRTDRKKSDSDLQRIDPAIDFDWGNDRPARKIRADNFSVRWEGTLTAPVSGEYTLDAEVDDELEIRLGSAAPLRANRSQPELGRVTLTAGEAVPFLADFHENGGEAYVRLYWTPPGGVRQIVPAAAFQPMETGKSATMQTLDPRGMPLTATLENGRRGRQIAIAGPAVPGVYRIATGGRLDGILPTADDGTLPLAVTRDPAESRFEPMTPTDLDLIRRRADLLQPRSAADILGVMTGKGFGREIGKWLALSAFALLLLESALCRWVSRSRRAADPAPIAFG